MSASPAPAPSPTTARSSRLPRKWIWIPLLVLIVAGAAVLFGGVPWCQSKASQAMRLGRFETAQRWLDRAGWLGLRDGRTELLRARLDRKRGRFEAMQDHLRKAAGLGYPRSLVAAEQLLAELQGGGLPSVDPRVANLFVRAEIEGDTLSEAYVLGCLRKYEFPPALTLLDSWETDFPKDPRPHFLRGRILEHSSAELQAKEEYRRASVKAGGVFAPAEYSLARIALDSGDPETALLHSRRCAEGLDVPAAARLGEAAALRHLERFSEAERVLVSIESQDRETLAQQLVELGQTAESAAVAYEAERGRVAAGLERNDEADRWLKTALDRNPHDWKLRYVYARTLSRLGRTAEAKEEFERVEETEKAVASCDQYLERIRKNPADVEARYELGRIFAQYISERQAEAWLSGALQYDPQHAGAQALLKSLRTPKAEPHEGVPADSAAHSGATDR